MVPKELRQHAEEVFHFFSKVEEVFHFLSKVVALVLSAPLQYFSTSQKVAISLPLEARGIYAKYVVIKEI